MQHTAESTGAGPPEMRVCEPSYACPGDTAIRSPSSRTRTGIASGTSPSRSSVSGSCAARRVAADARSRPVATRGSCSTGRPSCSTTTSTSGPSQADTIHAPRRERARVDRAVEVPHGRVHGLGRDHRPQPAGRHAARVGARRRDAGRLPPRHVRPHRADAADPAPRRHRPCRACGAAFLRRSTPPGSGGLHPTARVCAPSTSTARTRTAAISRAIPRSSRRAPTTTTSSSAPPLLDDGGLLLMNGTDHHLPQPGLGKVVAAANDAPGRLPVLDHVAPRVPRVAADHRAARVVGRAAIRCARERADGRRVEPGRRPPGVRGAPNGRSSAAPSR